MKDAEEHDNEQWSRWLDQYFSDRPISASVLVSAETARRIEADIDGFKNRLADELWRRLTADETPGKARVKPLTGKTATSKWES